MKWITSYQMFSKFTNITEFISQLRMISGYQSIDIKLYKLALMKSIYIVANYNTIGTTGE